MLFDSMGCRGHKGMHRADWERLTKAGIQVAEFFPAVLGKLQLRVNYRNHRKIAVIDGRMVMWADLTWVGNTWGKTADSGTGETPISVEGSAVTSLAVRFVLDWNYAAKENIFLEDRLLRSRLM